jgi:phage antirepressor YoqD-like protein
MKRFYELDMESIFKKIRTAIAFMLILTACAEIDQPFVPGSSVTKIETKWVCDTKGERKLKVYDKEYDKNGKLIKVTEYSETGSISSVKNIQYSNQGSNEVTNFYNSKGNSDSLVYHKNILNEQGLVSDRIETNGKGDTLSVQKYKYDFLGNIVKSSSSIFVGSEAKNVTVTDYVYNKSGSLSVSVQKDAITGSIQKKDSVVYNGNSNQIEKISFDSNGIALYRTIIYNKYGKIQKEIETDKTGKIIRTFIYDYIFF